jgi:hypothetical protein
MNDPILVRDAIDNLVDYVQGGTQDVEQRLFKRIIREAYREFVEVQPWSWFEAEATLQIPFETATTRLRYDHLTRQLRSDFPILAVYDTTPVRVLLPVEFAAKEGETIAIKNIDGTPDGNYIIHKVGPGEVYELQNTTGPSGDSTQINQWVWMNSNTHTWWNGDSAAWASTSTLDGNESVCRFAFSPSHLGSRATYAGTSYPVVKYIDDATVVLSDTANPGSSLAGADFKIQQNQVLLPPDYHKMGWVTESTGGVRWSDAYIESDSWLGWEQANYGQINRPFRWTIMPSSFAEGRWEIRWAGNLGSNRRISFIYTRRPADELRWSGVEPSASSADDGNPSITCTFDSRTVTGVNTAFTKSMVGAYLRIGRTKTSMRSEPSGLDGKSPYEYLYRIESVQSPTSLTISAPSEADGASLSFLISSKIDLPREHINAFYALCQKLYAFKTQDDDRIMAATKRYRDSLTLAMEGDYKVRFNREASNSFFIPSPYGHPRNANFGTKVSTPFGN